jgi:hypothetical protein
MCRALKLFIGLGPEPNDVMMMIRGSECEGEADDRHFPKEAGIGMRGKIIRI